MYIFQSTVATAATASSVALLLLAVPAASATPTQLGVATAAYQIEGAYDVDGRGMSIWDTFVRVPGKIFDNSTGDIATDHYHRVEEDLDFIPWLGATTYRFSISWPRLLPNGNLSVVNDKGVAFYNRLIDGLLARNITPFVTLWHWDTPQALQDEYGAWEHDKIIHDFQQYASLCFRLFGDRVKHWITLNEPLTVASLGYAYGDHAPGVRELTKKPYEAGHRMILAHAATYHMYHEVYGSTQNGKISIALNSDFVQPKRPKNRDDQAAAQRGLLWRMGWFADPLVLGDYPKEMRTRVGDRLPAFKPEDKVKGTLDYFCLNHYTTLEATSNPNNDADFNGDPELTTSFPEGAKGSASSWLVIYPKGIYGMIKWLQQRYDLTGHKWPLVITESGVSNFPGVTQDDDRVEYLKGYIVEAFRARDEFKIDLSHYCVWSLLDNFEWARGYTERFGLIDVDFASPNRTRTPKVSAQWLRSQALFQVSA